MPGPRKLCADERLALSNEALKMNGIAVASVISLQLAGDIEDQRLAFDHAGAGNQKQRPVGADLDDPHSFMRAAARRQAWAARGMSRARRE